MNTTNTLLIVLVVILVAFGVWYFAAQKSPVPQEESSGIEVNIGGDEGVMEPTPTPGY